MEATMTFELSIEFKEKFQQALDSHDVDFIRSSLEGVNTVDISIFLDEFDSEECKYVFDLLSPEIGSKILEGLEKDIRKQFMKQFSTIELASFIEFMDSDDGTDILYEMDAVERNEVIRHISDEEKASNFMELLEYDEDVAGGLMAKELIKANLNWSVSWCIEEIRLQAENIQKIYSVYVVDDKENLLGKVSIKKLIIGKPGTIVADIYDDQIISVETSTSEEEVVDIMQKYDLEVVPVVNARGRLVGRITIDDVVDVIRENAEEERQLMTGISLDIEEDDSIWKNSCARLPWLIIGIVGGLAGAYFLGFFKEDIIFVPALAFFIPLITASGGNVGIQSSSVVVQSLANPSVFSDNMFKRLFKIFLVAIVNGVILSLIIFGSIIAFMGELSLATTVAGALFSVVLIASFMGTFIPLLLNRFGINPALASGPFITTTNDLLGLVIYFSIAHLLYNL